MYIVGGLGIWHSTDNGVNWDEQNESKNVIDFNDKYLASTKYFGDILISDDGVAWQDITFDLETGGIYDVSALHYHNGTVFAVLRDGLYRLPVFQKNWERLQWPVVNPDDAFFPGITFESHNNILIAGVEGQGMFISGNNGNTWLGVNEGLEDLLVLSSTMIEGEIYIGVEGGIWKRPLSEFATVGTNENINDLNFSVSPVPAHDYININFGDIHEKETILFSLFDSKGTCIKTLEAEAYSNIQMDVRDVPSGIYFLQARINDRQGIIRFFKN